MDFPLNLKQGKDVLAEGEGIQREEELKEGRVGQREDVGKAM